MKLVRWWLSLFVVSASMMAAATVQAQDPAEVGPHIYHCVFENERVRVCEVRFKAGDEIGMHSHPDHFAYVVSPGTLDISRPDGSTQHFEGTEGQVVWLPAETHAAKNIGTTEMRLLVVELKPAAESPQSP